MLTPDKELALGILDALDDKNRSGVVPFRYGGAMGHERAWVEQECEIIDRLYAWLERQEGQARHDVPLQQAITTLCNRLVAARNALLQDLADMDAAAERAWWTPQRGGDRTQAVTASGLRRAGNDKQGTWVDSRSGACYL
jgi:hypothetical protein